ncbi:MAG: sll0787 family AIR synthase-like protein [Pseudomonadota bacterium]
MDLHAVAQGLHSSRGVAHKRDIAAVVATLGIAEPGAAIAVGDDCAAIPDGEGFLLFAIEGFLNEFLAAEPWFAGWCGVMVNVSDIYAMGGRPIAVVDALWSAGSEKARPVLDGLASAARTYGVPVVGGHSNARCDREQFSVAILGRATKLLSSFDARPGDVLLSVTDLRGTYRPHFSNWDASSGVDGLRLRGDLELLPRLAEDGLCKAAKDISQAGLLGTLLMLLECSGVGATVNLRAVPMPPGSDAPRWLLHTFPSYGFLLSVKPQHVAAVMSRFAARDLACAAIGVIELHRQLRLRDGSDEVTAWDFAEQALIGCGPAADKTTSQLSSGKSTQHA